MIKVLSVDDHALLREGIAALTAEAANEQDAIEKFRLHGPDVMLMDLQMPAMNAFAHRVEIRGVLL